MKNIFLFSVISLFFLNPLLSKTNDFNTDFSEIQNEWVDSIFDNLTLREKIGQLFIVASYSNKSVSHEEEIIRLIKNFGIGGVMFLQGSPKKQKKMTRKFQQSSEIPLLIAQDAEWGLSMRLDSSFKFPWPMTLGACDDKQLAYKMGYEIANQCKSIGVNMNLAPVADINSNPKNPIINNRSFGEDSKLVSELSDSYMRGLQENGVLACAKHFPGHGDTDKDSHKTLPTVGHNIMRLKKYELKPFKKLISSGVSSIMTAHLNVPSIDNSGVPTSLSKKAIKKQLINKMNFKGLIITDALNMKGVSEYYEVGELEYNALVAGNDILLMSSNVSKAIDFIENAIESGKLSIDDINLKCRKVLNAKFWIKNNYKPINESNDIAFEVLNEKIHRKSITLLKNNKDLIPLKRLDTLSIASLTIGGDLNYFNQTLSNYSRIKSFKMNDSEDVKTQAKYLDSLSRYNLVIVSIYKSDKNPWIDYKIKKDLDIFLQTLGLQNKIIITTFSSPYTLNSLLTVENFEAIVLGYQSNKYAQKYAAQSIFGGIEINSKVPVTTRHFKKGHGLKSQKTRLGYINHNELDFTQNNLIAIDSLIEEAIKEKAFPGCQVLISKDKNIFFHKSYGFHTYKQNHQVKNNDVYDLASITKIISTVPILMKMTDEKLFKLDEKIGSYDSLIFKSLLGSTSNQQILAHQAGLVPWIPFYQETFLFDSISNRKLLNKSIYSSEKDFEFDYQVAKSLYSKSSFQDTIVKRILESKISEDKKYLYSDLGFYLYKKIIENSYQLTQDKILNKIFLKKLGMENMCYNPFKEIDMKRIVPTEVDNYYRNQLLIGHVHDMGAALQDGVGGHAGIFSSSNDLAKFMQLYLDNGMYGDERFLNESTIKKFTSRQYVFNENRRGAGFDKPCLEDQEVGVASKNVSMKSFGHTGFTGTLAWADPEKNIILIFLSNRIHPNADNKKLIEMNLRTELMRLTFDMFDNE